MKKSIACKYGKEGFFGICTCVKCSNNKTKSDVPNENPYYDLYVKETKAHNACALREQALLKDVEFAGREMKRLEDALKKEKADHADTQQKWYAALDIGIRVVKERDLLRDKHKKLSD